MTNDVDLAIVGASFAGLACARAAAARGLRTVVLERKPDPGAWVHTTGILVKEAGEVWDPPLRRVRKIRRVRLYAPSFAHVDLVSPGYHFLATDTAGLLRWWADEARDAGARIVLRTPVRAVAVAEQGQGYELAGHRARVVVGADGPRSRIAASLGLGRNTRFLRGHELELVGVRGIDEDCLHVFLDPELAPGYIGWAVPGIGVTQIGLACRQVERATLEPFVRKLGRVFDLSDARIVARRAGRIPIGGPVSPAGRGRALLAGDAAGWVSPLTAGGIHPALHFGRRAGLAIATHLDDGGPEPWRVLAREIPKRRFKRGLRTLLDLDPPASLYDRLLGNPVFRRAAAALFFHGRAGLLREPPVAAEAGYVQRR